MKIAVAIAGLFALSACANGVTVSRVDHAHQYSPLEISAAGGLPVTVMGNPFDVSQESLTRAVVDSMQGSTFGIPVRFYPARENGDPESRFRVVMAFASGTGADPGALCRSSGSAYGTTAKSSSVTLLGALCSTDSDLSHGTARASGVAGPGSDGFDALVSQLTLSMFPNKNPRDDSDSAPAVFPLN